MELRVLQEVSTLDQLPLIVRIVRDWGADRSPIALYLHSQGISPAPPSLKKTRRSVVRAYPPRTIE